MDIKSTNKTVLKTIISRLKHYGQAYGQEAAHDTRGDQINPAAFFTDDAEENTQFIFNELYAKEKTYEEYRRTGVHRYFYYQSNVLDKSWEPAVTVFV